MRKRLCCLTLILAASVPAQDIHLKARTLSGSTAAPHLSGAIHQLVQFDHPPSAEDLSTLVEAGAQIVAIVPDNAIMVALPSSSRVPPAIRFHTPLEVADKLSTSLSPSANLAMVEFHMDVAPAAQDAVAAAEQLELQHPAKLLAHHAIVNANMRQLRALAAHDEVAYIFPADPALLAGNDMVPCAGMLTTSGPVPQYATIVHGWDLDTDHAAHLTYVLGSLTAKVSAVSAQSEILRAMQEWSKYTNVTFQAGTDPTAPRTVVIKFVSGAHGDPYPFTPSGGILAHTFYPVPINAESIAGDMHLNMDENWGTDIDIYSVALHEFGHALGLGHTDNPGDVMYPYYHRGMQLSANDIAGVRSLYGSAGSTPVTAPPVTQAPTQPPNPTPAPAPITLSLNPAPAPGMAASINAAGSVSGGTPPISIQWQTDHAQSGSAVLGTNNIWIAAGIPLATGNNTVTVTALDSAHQSATRTAIITRAQAAPLAGSAPVSVTITSPASSVTTTNSATLSLAGKASSGAGIAQIIWQTAAGASGTATGTGPWLVTGIPLYIGTNTIIVRAYDAKGATAWATAVVVRH